MAIIIFLAGLFLGNISGALVMIIAQFRRIKANDDKRIPADKTNIM